MPIEWKQPSRFKPATILRRIESFRTVNSSGRVSFSGFAAHECVPTLLSMLSFPPAGDGLAKEPLIWKALGVVKEDLTPENFVQALRLAFKNKLAVREQDYWLLTSMSIVPAGLPRKLSVLGCTVEFSPSGYPNRFLSARDQTIARHRVDAPVTPTDYCPIIIKTRAKSASSAYSKAMQSADLVRAILCLMANSPIQITFGTPSFKPLNAIRAGSRHTVHVGTGENAEDGLWFEPMFSSAKPYKFDKPEIVSKNLSVALKRIQSSALRDSLVSSLTRFVRALDHPDFSSAFLKLWSALETLTLSEPTADYDKLIHRVAFLFSDQNYHVQVLEHFMTHIIPARQLAWARV